MDDPDRTRGLYGKYLVRKIKRGDGGLCAGSPNGVHIPAPGLGQACSYCAGPRHDELVDPGPVFVLAYARDAHARAALSAYADSCETDYPQLAADLRDALAAAEAAEGAQR